MAQLYAFDHQLRESDQSTDVHKEGALTITLDLRVEDDEWANSVVYSPTIGVVQRVIRVDVRNDKQVLWELARSILEEHYGVIDIMGLSTSSQANEYGQGMPSVRCGYSLMVRDDMGPRVEDSPDPRVHLAADHDVNAYWKTDTVGYLTEGHYGLDVYDTSSLDPDPVTSIRCMTCDKELGTHDDDGNAYYGS